MEYLETTCARVIVQRITQRPVFFPGIGAKCPLCGNYAPTNSGPRAGIRYHHCPECGFTYSSRDAV